MTTVDQARTVSAKEKEFLGRLREVIRSFCPSATILLYGSVARGAKGAESDYDIVILTDASLSREEEDMVEDAIYDLQLVHGVAVSAIFHTKSEWESPLYRVMPFHQEVDKDAVVL
jgi:predicted nucleotidyltransferase